MLITGSKVSQWFKTDQIIGVEHISVFLQAEGFNITNNITMLVSQNHSYNN